MRNHDIEMILRGLYLSEYGQYNKEEVIRAILWANDLGVYGWEAVMSMTLKQAAISLIARWHSPKWKDQECTAGFIYRLDDAVLACNPVDYEQIEQEFFKEEGIADTRIDSSLHSFIEGVRFAERMHGVTEGCNEDK